MASIVSIKFNDEEAEILGRAHAASGVAGLSSHIKQVYFDAVRLQVDVLQGIRDDLDRIGASVERLREHQAETAERGAVGSGIRGSERDADADLLLSILCGLYVMVHKSVGDSVRAQADQALEISAIESYLKGR
jgi:hypothetical protein